MTAERARGAARRGRATLLLVAGVALLGVTAVRCAPTAEQYSRGMDWLSRYGYLPPPDMQTGRLQTKEGIERALREMQRFAGLRETGRLDAATLSLMATPRCSLPDIVGSEDLLRRKKRKRRYALSGLSWDKREITWSMQRFPSPARSPKLRPEQVEDIMTYALAAWSKVAPLHFQHLQPNQGGLQQQADIRVSFSSGYHDDGYPFDGKGGTLAHAFFPGMNDMAGDTHFDDGESWTYGDESDSTDLFTVAVHEFGHALGLSHSSSSPSIMRPYYQGAVGDLHSYTLPIDDQLGIQALYGTLHRDGEHHYPPHSLKTTWSPPNPTLPNRCDGGYDAIANIRGEVFFFRGPFFWRVQHSGSLVSFNPALIQNFWIGLPPGAKRIDAVYERTDGHIVFFIGDQYWVFRDRTALPGYPRALAEWGMRNHAGRALDRVEAVFVWAHNGKTYLFSGGEFWRFDEGRDGRKLEGGYPKLATLWTGVPPDPDDIITWGDGDTYFFKNTSYWVLKRGGLGQGTTTSKSVVSDWMKCDIKTPTRSPKTRAAPDCCCSRAPYWQISPCLMLISFLTIITPLF
uniref:Peptidase metallopeptidase domain-containing protein n=1 Tax=Denticeps clupeoides TaxID=299321 RepID=A0AAY4CJR5_9TELE